MLTDMQSTLEIAQGAADNDPDIGLRAVAALRALTERLEILQVDNARRLGWPGRPSPPARRVRSRRQPLSRRSLVKPSEWVQMKDLANFVMGNGARSVSPPLCRGQKRALSLSSSRARSVSLA